MAFYSMLDDFRRILQAFEKVISLRQTKPAKLSDIRPFNGPVFSDIAKHHLFLLNGVILPQLSLSPLNLQHSWYQRLQRHAILKFPLISSITSFKRPSNCALISSNRPINLE